MSSRTFRASSWSQFSILEMLVLTTVVASTLATIHHLGEFFAICVCGWLLLGGIEYRIANGNPFFGGPVGAITGVLAVVLASKLSPVHESTLAMSGFIGFFGGAAYAYVAAIDRYMRDPWRG